jgi:uncharacterized protein (DUF433 family)
LPTPQLARKLLQIRARQHAGTSIPTAVLHERWKAGDSITDLAEDYDRPAAEIEEALRYEAA